MITTYEGFRLISGDSLGAVGGNASVGVLTPTPQVGLRFAPIVDLREGLLVGYTTRPYSSGDGPQGLAASPSSLLSRYSYDASTLLLALDRLPTLPLGTYLSVRCAVASLVGDASAMLLDAELTGLVLELDPTDEALASVEVRSTLTELREAGAMVALSFAYREMRRDIVASVAPEIVVIPAPLLAHSDRASAEYPRLAASLRGLRRSGAWILAEGIDTPQDLLAARAIGAHTGSGRLFGRTEPHFATIDRATVDSVLAADIGFTTGEVGTAYERTVTDGLQRQNRVAIPPAHLLVLNDAGEPVQLVSVVDGGPEEFRVTSDLMIVHLHDELDLTLSRALTRDEQRRFHPVICVDALGRCVGYLTIATLIERAVHAKEQASSRSRFRPGGGS